MSGEMLAATVRRWWIYQRERFPMFRYAALTAVFVLAVLTYSAAARGRYEPSREFSVRLTAWLAASACVFLLFFQMRVADEFKDADDDAAFRPYRPVPRGLIRLMELRVAAVMAAAVQLLLVLLIDVRLLLPLVLVWSYLGLMTREFFARQWLRRHPVVYLWSHLLLMPAVAFFISAFEWMTAGDLPPAGLPYMLLLSFCAPLVLEIGRKIRSPHDEEAGVETYTVLWGRWPATAVWLCSLAATAAVAWLAGGRPEVVLAVVPVLALIWAIRFLWNPAAGRGRSIDRFSEAAVLCILLSVGPAATFFALMRRAW
jgi:4-hydroxybenzoate polyprenyltransferase